MEIPDITKLPFQFSIAIIGVVFSVFSLIYNETYIIFGFVTFLYGVIAFWTDKFYWNVIIAKKDDRSKNMAIFIWQSILIFIWLAFLLVFFFRI